MYFLLRADTGTVSYEVPRFQDNMAISLHLSVIDQKEAAHSDSGAPRYTFLLDPREILGRSTNNYVPQQE